MQIQQSLALLPNMIAKTTKIITITITITAIAQEGKLLLTDKIKSRLFKSLPGSI